jgi:hypothetical protein
MVSAFPPEVAARSARVRRLLVVPHETLWRVPFEALAPGGQDMGAAQEVIYIASVSASTATMTAVDLPAGSVLLAAGAPDLSPALAAQVAQTAPGWIIRPAAGVRPELDQAAGAAAATASVVLTGPEATETALRRALPEAGAIHLASPFRVNAASPLFSPILLTADAPASTAGPGALPVSAADGVLDLREIMNLDLRASTVVLSDPAALSMRDAADDVALVQWAWWAAGVPSMALTRWAAEGAGQELFIRELHAELRAGRALATAAQSARRAVRRSAGRAAPFHWAGWMIAAGR